MKWDKAKRLTPRQIVYIKATFNAVTPSGNVDCNVMLENGEIAHVLTAPHFVLDNDLQQKGKPKPYCVVDAHTHWDVCRNDERLITLVSYSKLRHPNAKAAAEAECKRLNVEWQTKVCRSEDGKEDI